MFFVTPSLGGSEVSVEDTFHTDGSSSAASSSRGSESEPPSIAITGPSTEDRPSSRISKYTLSQAEQERMGRLNMCFRSYKDKIIISRLKENDPSLLENDDDRRSVDTLARSIDRRKHLEAFEPDLEAFQKTLYSLISGTHASMAGQSALEGEGGGQGAPRRADSERKWGS